MNGIKTLDETATEVSTRTKKVYYPSSGTLHKYKMSSVGDKQGATIGKKKRFVFVVKMESM